MANDCDDLATTRTALRYLYGAAGAHVHDDGDAMQLLLGQALAEVALGDLLDAGALSVAEQLRDIAASRQLRPVSLLRVLSGAHAEMAGESDLFTILLDGAAAYLGGDGDLWDVEQLCQLAACPTASLEAMVTILGATITWRARDLGVAPAGLIEQVCLGLAVREVGLLGSPT